MERIVMVKGGVETLSFFAEQMARRFEELGSAVFFYDLRDEEGSSRRLRKFLRPGKTALVTFNFQGLEREEGVYKEGVGYVWDGYRIPCYNIVADHPYFYHNRLEGLPEGYRHISVDRCHEAYFKDFYPEYRSAGFLPLAGSRDPGGASFSGAVRGESGAVRGASGAVRGASGAEAGAIPAGGSQPGAGRDGAERDIGVVFAGNYTELEFFEPYINWINDEYAAFYRGIIDELIASPEETVEAVALRHCEREMGEVPRDQLRIALHKMIFIDLYVRNYWRGEAVRSIANAGIPIHVVGDGWQRLEGVSRPECVIAHPQTDTAGCLAMLSRAKVSLNVMPWFKDGAHDRVFSSVLCGAACVTDRSRYLEGELSDGEGVAYYDLGDMGGLPDLVRELLSDESRREDAVSRGFQKISGRHEWAERADVLAGWMDGGA